VKLERDDLPPPQLELAKHPAKVNTPVIPAFDLPPGEPGFHGPRELRLHGKSVLGTEVKVKGYVTAIYDCVEGLASANPRVTRDAIQAAIHDAPSLRERTMFWLGDARDTMREASISVVGPSLARARPVIPQLSLGDYIVVTGKWGAEASTIDRADAALLYASV